MMNAIETLKRGVVARDPKLIGQAVDSLRTKGFRYRDCYRVALAANPELTEPEWEDLMALADEQDSR